MKGLLLIPGLIAAAGIYAVFDEDSGIRSWRRMRDDLGNARDQIVRIRAENERLRSLVVALEVDSFAQERAVREGLEFARPGEVIIRLPDARTSL